MIRITKSTNSKEPIKGSKRQIRIENAWLLYNYETLRDWFWTRKAAVRHAQNETYYPGDKVPDGLPEHYQILRGTITVELYDAALDPITHRRKVL